MTLVELPTGEEVTEEEATLRWVNRYRESRGMPTLTELPDTLAEATNGEVLTHRAQITNCWADTNDKEIAQAIFKAGGFRVAQYLRDRSNPLSTRWEVTLPSYMWAWAKR